MINRQGQQLDSYQLIRLLGTGSFGEVYLAQHVYRTSEAPVAIKVLSPLTQDDLQSFLGEARTRLKHPNIVQVLDFGIDERIPFIVMEYAPNGTLRQRHPKGTRVSLSTTISYVKQIASALQYAHDGRLVHRDIKPENMLIGDQNQILLSDFGLVTVAHSIQSQSIDQIVGTISYMAPEQIYNKPQPASDQYSLGVVVYEWLCGERPFQGTFTEMAIKQATVPPPPLREKIPTIASDIEQIVMTTLAKDPKQRFDSVLAFATALEQACATTSKHATQSVEPELLEHTSWPVNSHKPVAASATDPSQLQNTTIAIDIPREITQLRIARRKIVLLGAGLLVGASSLTWLVLSHQLHIPSMFNPTPTPVRSPKPTPPPIPPGTLLSTYPGHNAFVNAVAWSPDGKRIASGSSDTKVQIWDASNGSNVLTYSGHNTFVEAVAWSPDGKRIASASWDMTVQVWDATNSSHVYTIYKGHLGYVVSVAWSPDGKRIASGSFDKTAQVWDAANGDLISTYKGHFSAVHTVLWSPDGKHIASGSLDTTVQVWDTTNGGHAFTYPGHSRAVRTVAWSPDGKRIASGSDDTTVRVWNAVDGSDAFSYRGHSGAVLAVAWSHNGKHIASGEGGNNPTVQVWNAADGSHVYTYKRHSSEVRTVAWSPDDKHIASGDNTTVQVWEAI